MATLFEFQQGQQRLTHNMMLDFTAILIGYGFPRDEARVIADKAMQAAKQHLEECPSVLRVQRF